MKFGLLAQNLLQEACYSLYTKDRNITEEYYNFNSGEHKDSHGAAYLRKFMNGSYSDSLDYLDCLINWAPQFEKTFIEKALVSDIWEGDNKNLSDEDKTVILKHFFITYTTYTGEFSYYNYLPLLRGVLSDRDEKLYKVDFEYSDAEIAQNNCSQYVFSNETWKFTNKKPAIEFSRFLTFTIALDRFFY